MTEKLEQAVEEERSLDGEIKELEKGREESEERTEVLRKMEILEGQIKKLNVELARFAEFDPDEVERVKTQTAQIKVAVNRWIDNIFNIQSWIVRTFGMDKREFDSQFEIPEDLDYID